MNNHREAKVALFGTLDSELRLACIELARIDREIQILEPDASGPEQRELLRELRVCRGRVAAIVRVRAAGGPGASGVSTPPPRAVSDHERSRAVEIRAVALALGSI